MDESRKRCIHCGEDMAGDAKRCPHCRSWQSKWYPDQQSIGGQLIGIVIVVPLLLVIFGFIYFFDRPSRTCIGTSELKIVSSEMFQTQVGERKYVGVLGALTNGTSQAVADPSFHVEVFNAEGALVDAFSRQEYGLVVGPHSSSSFRIMEPAARNQDAYRSHRVELRWITKARK